MEYSPNRNGASEVDPNTNDGSARAMFSAGSFPSSQVQVNDFDIGANTVPGHQVGGVVSNQLGMGMPGLPSLSQMEVARFKLTKMVLLS